jgi:ribosomal protein S27E
MKVYLKYKGYAPNEPAPYHYHVLTETGIADEIFESVYTDETVVEMPDELWSEGSGWADLQCNDCGHIHKERCYPGAVITCPVCGMPELIPEDAILEPSNVEDTEYDGYTV